MALFQSLLHCFLSQAAQNRKQQFVFYFLRSVFQSNKTIKSIPSRVRLPPGRRLREPRLGLLPATAGHEDSFNGHAYLMSSSQPCLLGQHFEPCLLGFGTVLQRIPSPQSWLQMREANRDQEPLLLPGTTAGRNMDYYNRPDIRTHLVLSFLHHTVFHSALHCKGVLDTTDSSKSSCH